MLRITIWNEYTNNQLQDCCQSIYPGGLHKELETIFQGEKDVRVRTAILSDPDNGVSEEILADTDVLIWWAHCSHDQVSDETVKRIVRHVHCGMGAIFLHSAHISKPFRAVVGTSGTLSWREANERERIWVTDPTHPIVRGIGESFVLEQEEMYGEPFDIPAPESTVMIGWFKGGNVFRSGVTYTRGKGKVFYFQPGHETHPTYKDANVRQVISNAARWAAPVVRLTELKCPNAAPVEPLN